MMMSQMCCPHQFLQISINPRENLKFPTGSLWWLICLICFSILHPLGSHLFASIQFGGHTLFKLPRFYFLWKASPLHNAPSYCEELDCYPPIAHLKNEQCCSAGCSSLLSLLQLIVLSVHWCGDSDMRDFEVQLEPESKTTVAHMNQFWHGLL